MHWILLTVIISLSSTVNVYVSVIFTRDIFLLLFGLLFAIHSIQNLDKMNKTGRS